MTSIRLIATLLAVASISALALAAPSATESSVKSKAPEALASSTGKPTRLVSGLQLKHDDESSEDSAEEHKGAAVSGDKLPEGAALRRRRDAEESEESEEERSGVGSSAEAVKKPSPAGAAHAEVAKPEEANAGEHQQSFIPKRPATLPPRQKLGSGAHLSRDVSTTKATPEEETHTEGASPLAEEDAVKVPTRRPFASKLPIHKREATTTKKPAVKVATTTLKPKVHRREATSTAAAGKPVSSGSKVTAAPPVEPKRPASVKPKREVETTSKPATRPLASRPSGTIVDAKVGRSTTLKPHVVHERETGAKVTSKTGRSTTPKSVHRREALSPIEHTDEDHHKEVPSTKAPVRAPLTRVPVRLLSSKAPEVPEVPAASHGSKLHRRSAGAKPTSSPSGTDIAKPEKSSEVHEQHETISIEKHDSSDASIHRQRRALDSVAEKKESHREVDVVVLPVLIRQMPPLIFRAGGSEDEETKADSETPDESKSKFNLDIDEVIKPSLKSFFKSRFDKEAKEALRFRRSAVESADNDASGEIGTIHLGTASASTTAQPGILDSFIKLFKPNGENATHGSTPSKAAVPTEASPSLIHGHQQEATSTSKPRVTLGYHNANNGQTVQEFQVSTPIRVPRPESAEAAAEVPTTTKTPVLHREKRQLSNAGVPGNRPAQTNAQKQPSRSPVPASTSSTGALVPRPKRTPIDEDFGAPAAEVEAPLPAELAYQGDFQSQHFEQQPQQQYPVVGSEDFHVDGAEDEA